MNKFKKISLTMVFITMISTFLQIVVVEANPENDYEMSVSYGVEGRYKGKGYIPVFVDITSLNKDFKGEIEVRVDAPYDSYDAYSTEISLEQGESIETIIPVNLQYNNEVISVHLIEDGESVDDRRFVISNGRVLDNNLFVGILSDDMNSLSYLGDITFLDYYQSVDSKLEAVELNKSLLINSFNIDQLDVIVISNYNMASFGERELEGLSSWIEKGGILIVSTGANESKVINNINGSLVNIKSTGTSEKAINIDSESLNIEVSELAIENGQIERKSGDEILLTSVEKGVGEILIFSFDIGLEPFISSNVAVSYMTSIFNEISNEVQMNNMNDYDSNSMHWILDTIPIDGVIDTVVLIVVMVLYILIIGIVIYVILKKIKKRDLMWIAIPVIAVVTSGILYIMSYNFRLNDIILNQINIVDVDENGEGTATTSISVASKYKEDLIIKKPEEVSMTYMNYDYYYNGHIEPEDVEKELRLKTTYTLDDSYFTFKDNSALGFNKFEIDENEISVINFETDFNLEDGKLNGTLKNNLDRDANKVLVVFGNIVWDLGKVGKGESVDIKSEPIDSSRGLQAYSEQLNELHFEYSHNDREESYEGEYRLISIYEQILRNISISPIVNSEANILVLTDMPVEYGLDFEGKSVSKYDTTLIVQDIESDFRDEKGNLNFPKGYFKGIVTYQSSNIYYDSYSNLIYRESEQDGEVDIDYVITEEMDITELTIVYGSDVWGRELSSGEISIYNYITASYDEIDIDKNGYKTEDIDKYINDNKLKVKMIINEYEATVPDIIVKGE